MRVARLAALLFVLGAAAAVPVAIPAGGAEQWAASTDTSDPQGVVGHIDYEPNMRKRPFPPPSDPSQRCLVPRRKQRGVLGAHGCAAAEPLSNADVDSSLDNDEATLSELGNDVAHLRAADSYLFSRFAQNAIMGTPGAPGPQGPPGAPGVAAAPAPPAEQPAAALKARRAQQLLANYESDAGALRYRLRRMVHNVRAATGKVGGLPALPRPRRARRGA
jgi:hypothetical protein